MVKLLLLKDNVWLAYHKPLLAMSDSQPRVQSLKRYLVTRSSNYYCDVLS